MQRSERLAEIVEIVRDGRLHLARDIADALQVSVRTIYRDIDTLVASGIPIDGERGVGYLLREPVFLPPMALSMTELEALSLGLSIVKEAADAELRDAAQRVMDKVGEHASNRRQAPKSWGFGVYAFERAQEGFRHMPLIRRAIREGLMLKIDYCSLDERSSTRVIRPLQMEYWGRVWTCSAWCELRNEFRAFRIDRMQSCEPTGENFLAEAGKTIEDYLKHVANQMDRDRTRS
jgi:predicted DNA-binding transcriptional regulator YafY